MVVHMTCSLRAHVFVTYCFDDDDCCTVLCLQFIIGIFKSLTCDRNGVSGYGRYGLVHGDRVLGTVHTQQ